MIHLQQKHIRQSNEGNVLFNNALNTFYLRLYGRKEGNVLINDALNTFYLRLYGRKEGNVLFNDALNTFYLRLYGRNEGNVLFNDALNTFYLRLYGVGYMVNDHSYSERKEMFYLTTHLTHFIYDYMALDIW